MPVMTGGDVIVEALARQGVSKVFSCPGGQFLPIYDALREHPKTELIVPRHEGAAALMACGYAIGSGKLSTVMTTVGAGVIYEAGGLLLAWRERLPVLSIAPQVQSYRMKPIQESLQACDQDELFRPFTKFRAIAYHYKRIPRLIGKAIKTAVAPEPGPTHLDVPVDTIFHFERLSDSDMKKTFPTGSLYFDGDVWPNPDAVKTAAAMIDSAERPLVLVGRGVERARAGAELEAFLEKRGLPAMASMASLPALPPAYKGNLAVARWWEGDDALDAMARTDLLVLIEADEETARLAQALLGKNPGLKTLQTAELSSSLGSILPVEVGIAGSVGKVLDALAGAINGNKSLEGDYFSRLAATAERLREKSIQSLGGGPRIAGVLSTVETVSKAMGEQDVVVCEGQMAATAAAAKMKFSSAHSAVLLADRNIPGAGLPLCQGIKTARPEAKVFLITDSGNLKRHSREFQTSSRYGLGVNTVVFQDGEKKPEWEVDFAKLAESLGVKAQRVLDPEEEITPESMQSQAGADAGILYDASEAG